MIAIALTGSCLRGNTQTSADSLNSKIPVEHLKADLRILQKMLVSSQPGLYLYTSEDSLNKIFNKIESSFTEPLTSIEFFRRIAPLNGILKNLHTRLWPSAAYEKAMETVLPRFPLDIYWDNNTMYVLRNHSNDTTIKEGFVIRSINGIKSHDVFETVLNCRVRDGFNESYPKAQASRNFSFYYAQMIGTPESFRLETGTDDGGYGTVDVEAIKASQIHDSRTNMYRRKYCEYSEDWDSWISRKEPALRFEIKDRFALLTVKTFYLPIIEENGQDYRAFLNESFEALKGSKIKHLIIDLRNNHGGTDPVAMSLMSHLHDSKIDYYERRSSIVKPDAKHVKKGNVYEIIGKGVWTGKIKPAKNVYKGNVYLLMNGYCVSAAAEFIGHLRNLNRAIFIGEEAGGNPVKFTGGVSLPVDLPHTRITGTIPLQFVEMNVSLKNTGNGVTPDYQVISSIHDVLDNRDVQMQCAIDLINKQN